jgi:hypothetical protein
MLKPLFFKSQVFDKFLKRITSPISGGKTALQNRSPITIKSGSDGVDLDNFHDEFLSGKCLFGKIRKL